MVLIRCGGDSILIEAVNHILLLCMELCENLFFIPHHIIQRFAVAQVDLIRDAVDCQCRYQAAPFHLDEIVAKGPLQFSEGNPGLIGKIAGDVYKGKISLHLYIKNLADIQHNFLLVGNNRDGSRFLHIRYLQTFFLHIDTTNQYIFYQIDVQNSIGLVALSCSAVVLLCPAGFFI